MQPGFDLRLRTMIKALSETVLPAVDPGNKAALEQTHIVIGSLELLREQIDYAHWYEVVDAKSMARLVESLAGTFADPTTAAAQTVAAETLATAARHDITLTALRDANRNLRDAISAIVEATFVQSDEALRNRVQRLVIDQSEQQITRERAFVARTKFDVFPDTLLGIEESLTREAV
jgi:hypothetical protein